MAAVESGLPQVQKEPSEALQIGVKSNGIESIPKDELRLSSSECVVSIKEILAQPCQEDEERPWEKLSIYQIPLYLKNGEDKAYVPQIVSLGPYHHGKKPLRPMEQHKLRCLRCILKRFNHDIGPYLDSVKKEEEAARACYEGTISMSSDDFVQMMVLDGCFVIELLRGVSMGFEELGYSPNDPIFSMRLLMVKIQQDMIMLENQIPLSILDLLLGLQLGVLIRGSWPGCRCSSLTLCTQTLVANGYSTGRPTLAGSIASGVLAKHAAVQLNAVRDQATAAELETVHSLLDRAPRCQDQDQVDIYGQLGDIRFRDRILWIPQLVIHDGTRSLFLNLIAFEQCHFNCSNYVTSYVVFMHNLIKSPEDVRYLRNKRIIMHCLGSDAEVVDLFNELSQKVALDIEDSYLYDLSTEVELRCFNWYSRIESLQIKCKKWKAILKHKYFDSPWSIISLIAAFILLVLTFIQSLYAVYGYYKVRIKWTKEWFWNGEKKNKSLLKKKKNRR
ncbi:UPF0481 protein At3g47200 [Eucalyptus grandis]|uniref:UPF0481 protein At3g47200 n=1 Tax=Eucalyptus grandis TaxID=71139 RepID=UPI00192E9C67|nr:UPF0481 protein At3g47200 [Eucalyptus grandis]